MKKNKIWENARLFVEKASDKLGTGIDENIKDLTITMRAFGFNTSQSCEGHIDHGYPYPWIEIRNEDPDKSLLEELRMTNFVEEFYEKRISYKYARIVVFHYKNRFRVQTYVKEAFQKIANSEDYNLFKENCSREMKDFAEFLRVKFWN